MELIQIQLAEDSDSKVGTSQHSDRQLEVSHFKVDLQPSKFRKSLETDVRAWTLRLSPKRTDLFFCALNSAHLQRLLA